MGIAMCTCVSHLHVSSVVLILVGSKCIHCTVGLSVEINGNRSVLCGRQEGSPVGDLPLMLTPAVAFRLLIHGNPFSGNDTNAEACMLKACLNPYGGWRDEYFQRVLKLQSGIYSEVIHQENRTAVSELTCFVTFTPVTYSGLCDADQQRHW